MTKVTEIRDGVYDVTSVQKADGRRYRAFLVDGPSATLFDTALDAGADTLLAGIDETGVEPDRVVVTHADHDHTGGLQAVVDEYNPTVWLSEQSSLDGVEPDKQYADGDEIGGFEALHLPGHKPDSYAFVNEDRGVVVSGDVVNGSDQRGLPPGYLVLPPAVYSTDLIALEENLERLFEYTFDAVLVYHGSSVLEDAKGRLNAFVNFPGKPEH